MHGVLVFLAAIFLSAFSLSKSQGAEIKVLSANAVKEAVTDLAARFEQSTGHKVTLTWAGTEAAAQRVAKGEAVDIVIIGSANIDKLIADGKLAAGSRRDFAKSGVGVAVRTGIDKPDISSGEGVKRAILAARSIAYSSGPSGFHVAEMIRKMGISDEIKDRVKQPPSGTQISDLLARGEADLGFQQVSELFKRTGIVYLGPLPSDIQVLTVYAIGLHPQAVPEAAAALLAFLTASGAAPAIREMGMDPG
jgi:molybdate transport system substrate-binding protein